MNMPVKNLIGRIALAGAVSACASLHPNTGLAAGIFDSKDALDSAVAPVDEQAAEQRTDQLSLNVADDLSYDDNLYRVPPSRTDLTTLPGIGPNPSRGDYIDSVTAGLDGEWLVANRQSLDFDLRAERQPSTSGTPI